MNKRMLKELKREKTSRGLRLYYINEERKALHDIDMGLKTKEGFLARKDFWRQFKKATRRGMEALEEFRDRWEGSVNLPWAGCPEYARIASLSNI